MSTSDARVTSLPRDRSAPRLARRWISEQINPLGLDENAHENVVLLVSELVTNVVMHTDSDPVLTLRVESSRILVGVQDHSGVLATIRKPEMDTDRPGGWGLRIVDELADSWGATYSADGTKQVWFTVEL